MPRLSPRAGLLSAGMLVATLWALAMPVSAHGHALLHDVGEGRAITVRLYFPDDDRPLFEPYQVFAPGSERPFQAGRVNALGEVTFRPDRPGEWRVQVTTADGHGARVTLQLDAELGVERVSATPGWAQRVLTGLGWLLGLFGLLALWRLHRATRPG